MKRKSAAGFVRQYRRRARRSVADALLRWNATNAALGRGYLLRLQWPALPPSANEAPRYGYGRPPHARLAEQLSEGDDDYHNILLEFVGYTDSLLEIPAAKTDPREPHWHNRFLFGIDGASLYCFTRTRAPRRYLEVGSGNSTLFVDRARRDGGIDMEIISIDPRPRRDIDSICDRIVRQPLETADLEIFSELEPGDIVFMDGTHRVFTNSDAVVFFLDVLPELSPGVLVGIHDVHLPDDYRPDHTDRHYSEQYLLAAYLLADSNWIQPVLPCWYASHHPELGGIARSLVPQTCRSHGVIFWLKIEPHPA